ncbi:MAG: glycoside hydrolase family 2 [Clostridia bacterium]|nr:glycoside hydrolase family 2 [Clostridia bacterium]
MTSEFDTFLSLDGSWTLYYAAHRDLPENAEYNTQTALDQSKLPCVPATVPGSFELDLMRAGVIGDVFYGMNPLLAQERENMHLWYTRRFTCKDEHAYDLIFDGVDTYADVYLNGILIGSTDNMLIAHTLDAGILCGENELVVHIKPIFLASRQHPIEAGVVTHLAYNAESLAVRKAAHMFGWDIMPRILSGGIWRSVRLRRRRTEYLSELYLQTVRLRPGAAYLLLHYSAAITGDLAHEYELRLVGTHGESRFEQTIRLWNPSGTQQIVVKDPHLWWTRDMGDQPLYRVTAELLHRGTLLDRVHFRTGICRFTLKRTSVADEHGEFCFYINGEPLFVRGTNWVPMDALHARDRERLPRALALLDDAGCNMVRFWGGNVYEDESMFDFCDEHGIAVWQDFAMGCATYPLTPHMAQALETEATAVVKKYRQHPCIAAWAGDNECDVATAWRRADVDPNRNLLTRRVLPLVLSRHDPTRVYIPSSPYVDETAYQSGNLENTPEQHLWGPRDYFKSDFYTKATASFASETGYHGCPAPTSIDRFISPEWRWPWQNNDEWQVHATCMELGEDAPYAFRTALMANQIKVLFGEEPETLERFAMASQASQAEAMKFFIERFRSAKWKRTGIIWWNLIDGWPQFSDAVVDYYYARKLAYHVIKRASAPVCLMLREPEDGVLTLVGANEHRVDVPLRYRVTDLANGDFLIEGEALLGANAATELDKIAVPKDGRLHFYVMEWEARGVSGKNHYVLGSAPYSFDEYYRYMNESGMWEADGFSHA